MIRRNFIQLCVALPMLPMLPKIEEKKRFNFRIPPDVKCSDHFYRNNPEKLKELSDLISKVRKF